ncbi:MAG: hypothetical protein F4Y41_14210 [Gammaproteobacteria bacterium]|nr:hypothetical protein [Gammaproteobacteria bacterium]MYE13420.1 hypothetical protein [Gammaproteobacteria bacterium]
METWAASLLAFGVAKDPILNGDPCHRFPPDFAVQHCALLERWRSIASDDTQNFMWTGASRLRIPANPDWI